MSVFSSVEKRVSFAGTGALTDLMDIPELTAELLPKSAAPNESGFAGASRVFPVPVAIPGSCLAATIGGGAEKESNETTRKTVRLNLELEPEMEAEPSPEPELDLEVELALIYRI